MTSEFQYFEQRTGFSLPPAVCDFFEKLGDVEVASDSLKLLPLCESRRLLENWPRYGFSGDRGYVPIAEDQNGDLFCVACADDCRGQVFHLAWAGEEELRFASLEDFVREYGVGGKEKTEH